MASVWTAEEVVLLRKLVLEENSPEQISKALQSHSRNSVIGKAHRLGLTFSGSQGRPKKSKRQSAAERTVQVKRRAPPVVRTPAFPALKEAQPVPAIKQSEGCPPSTSPHSHEEWMCECIFDDGLLCGGRRAGRSSWCEYHKSVFTAAPQPRRRYR